MTGESELVYTKNGELETGSAQNEGSEEVFTKDDGSKEYVSTEDEGSSDLYAKNEESEEVFAQDDGSKDIPTKDGGSSDAYAKNEESEEVFAQDEGSEHASMEDVSTKYGFEREEMYKVDLAGTVNPHQRHFFLCYKTPESWPIWLHDKSSGPLPYQFSVDFMAACRSNRLETRLTICERNDDAKLWDGDLLIFPERKLYRGLKDTDAQGFIRDVITLGKPWSYGVAEAFTGSYIFVCAHGNRDKRCGVCGPALIKKFKEVIESKDLKNVVFVSACSHIGGNKNSGSFAGNVIIFSPGPDGKIAGNWYGYVTPNDVLELVEKQVMKGEIVDRIWRGQMETQMDTNDESDKEDDLIPVRNPNRRKFDAKGKDDNTYWMGFVVWGTTVAAIAVAYHFLNKR